MMDAARLAKVRRFVYISGTGVTLGRGAVTNIDDTVPRGKPLGVLCATRVQSEAEVERVAANGLDAVIVRFPHVWGPGATLRPTLRDLAQSRRFWWIGGGHQRVSICHIDNAVHGLILAAEKGVSGKIYWISDAQTLPLQIFFRHLREVRRSLVAHGAGGLLVIASLAV